MPLENATTIAQLDEQWPHGGDGVDRGDDHIRLLKHVLKSTFPGPNVNGLPGQGFSTPLTVDPTTLNGLEARLAQIELSIKNARPIGSIELRLDNIDPSTLFPNTVWTRVDGDYSLHVGNGNNGGTTTGDNNPLVPLPLHNHNATFTGNQLPPHSHGSNIFGGNSGPTTNAARWDGYSFNIPTTSETAGTPSGTVTVSQVGNDQARLDVRGARIFVNVWKRTA